MAKRYYWLKLKNDFFTQARMKKLRKQCDDIYSNDVTIYRDREEIEKDIELEIEKEKDKKHTPKENYKEKFVAPQECEVERYLADRNVKSFTAKEFINYYAALGWKNKHGTPIADWKALLDTWIDRKDESNPEESREKTKFDFLESDFIRVLEDAGAISDGGLDYGVLREHDEWIEKIQEAEHKANEYNHHEGVCGWKPASRLGKGEWQ